MLKIWSYVKSMKGTYGGHIANLTAWIDVERLMFYRDRSAELYKIVQI